MTDQVDRCGFISLVGAPNAGKSTLINRLVGAKVSIVTPKVQTTRTRVLGIVTSGSSQLIFMDTPGIHVPHHRLERAMVDTAWHGVKGTDNVALIVDAVTGLDSDVKLIIHGLMELSHNVILIINKIDLVRHTMLLELSEKLHIEYRFSETFMVSSLTGDGTGDLIHFFEKCVPQGPWLYPEDQISDMPQRLMSAEITREKLFLQLHQELPYELTVETETWIEKADGSLRIDQVIFVRRDSQKAIVLGSMGKRIKRVGESSRNELESILGARVHLFLFVKVRKNWIEERARFEPWNLKYDA